MDEAHKSFTSALLQWHKSIDRVLPWKATRDPYKIWVSEIVLQQTRVAQGTDYYLRIIEAFPTVESMAQAEEDEIMRLWQGLGYYSRARNMHSAAKKVVADYDGKFPDTHDGILSLPGVGPYTAAAIASFAYEIPKAVVDGNVYRVLSRYYGIDTPIDTTLGKKQFAQLSQDCLGDNTPSKYNQAIMDFGALQCTPKNPSCTTCPLNGSCASLAEEAISRRPVKSKKLKRTKRYFYYFLIEEDNQILIAKRTKRDIWQGLYELPLIETTESREIDDVIKDAVHTWGLEIKEVDEEVYTKKHVLSHQDIMTHIIPVKGRMLKHTTHTSIKKEKYKEYAFPIVLADYLDVLI